MAKLILICHRRDITLENKRHHTFKMSAYFTLKVGRTKIMNKTQLNNQIYENKGVYGDEEKFLYGTSDRLGKMIEIVNNLTQAPKNVLDIGCGTGYFAHLTKSIYPKANVYATDISQKALRIGRRRYKNIKFIRADAEKTFPFPDNFYDLVISGEHIEHVVNTDAYLLEINRVMGKDGVLLITTPNLVSWLNRILVLLGKWPYFMEPSFQKTIPMFSFFNYTFPDIKDPPFGHLRLFTKEELGKLLEIYGFKISKIYGSSTLQNYRFLIKFSDFCFSAFPSLATGLVISATKDENL